MMEVKMEGMEETLQGEEVHLQALVQGQFSSHLEEYLQRLLFTCRQKVLPLKEG